MYRFPSSTLLTWYFQNISIPYNNCSDQRSKYQTQKTLNSRERRRTKQRSSISADHRKFEDKGFNRAIYKDETDGRTRTLRKIKVGDKCKSNESATIIMEKARITYLQPLKAKLQSVNPLVDDQVTQCKVNQSEYHNPYRLRSIGVPTSYHTTDSRDTSRIFQRSIRQPCQCEVLVNIKVFII